MQCVTQPFTIGKLRVNKNLINSSPPYQRESGLWSRERKQLFIDSLFNNFDVPKLYFHQISPQTEWHYAIIDGKQRLDALWDFVVGDLELADDFELSTPELDHPPSGKAKFASLTDDWQQVFLAKQLDVVLVQEATEDDIEDLFSRLNNGEPLNAAEKRNAMGGKIPILIRSIAGHPYFKDHVAIKNTRYQHYESAAKLLLLEKTQRDTGAIYADLKKRFLDHLVRQGASIPDADSAGLKRRVDAQLKVNTNIFSGKPDQLLNKQAYIPMYYLWVKVMTTEYASGPQFHAKLRQFLEYFHVMRQENLNKIPEEERDPVLLEFGRLVQQGTNDLNSIQDRVSMLRRYFLQAYPETVIKDPSRAFSDEERLAIWILGGKICADCGRDLPELGDMEADHLVQWAFGGETSLSNARALCGPCNGALAKTLGSTK